MRGRLLSFGLNFTNPISIKSQLCKLEKMITIAIAGGTSLGLGRSIVRAAKSYPSQLQPIVLGRKSSQTPAWLEQEGVEVRKVDYADENSLVEALKGVHTVLSVLLAKDGTWASTQISLLNASLRAGVSRFAPAEWGCGTRASARIEMLAPTVEVMNACREAKEQNPGFEYAGFHLGLFMNYLGYGARKGEEEALNGLNDSWVFVWDVKGMKAAIPLTKEGKVPKVSMMEIGDAGKFAVAACLLPKGQWQEDFSMVGDTVALDEVVKIVEQVRGKKMDVTFRSYEQVVEEMDKEEIVYPNKFWGELEEMQCRDLVGEGIMEPILNNRCPDVKPMTVKDYVGKFWS
ncbi:NAD(P)-binding protein [Polyplosphaeria fusca]|uniref:NAD(P)-binding protein n=1 Tax=Polyplosphaeria fusca TaxID=682080 RepID=A0A9P4V8E5_9PLEO|nr:NAD(P)-binding protein [Polyplosphaeria fusca]